MYFNKKKKLSNEQLQTHIQFENGQNLSDNEIIVVLF